MRQIGMPLGGAAIAIAIATSVSSPALAQQQVRNFDISAQPAADGVVRFAQQAGIQVLAPAEATRGHRIGEVRGRLTVQEALRRLTASGQLKVLSFDGRTAVLSAETPGARPIAYQSAAPLPAVEPEAIPTAAAALAQAEGPIQDIVVTASKRQESLSKAPLAVSALTSQALEQQGITSVQALNTAIPNVQLAFSGGGGLQISIRGISSTNQNELGNPAVAFHINGVYESRPEGINALIYDVDRIEVVRGPQGTLYGRNATAGSINVITATPKNKLEAFGDVSYGNFSDVLIRGVVNVPVTDRLAVRAAVVYEKNDGYIHTGPSVGNYGKTDGISDRVTALWKPVDGFSWQVEADYYRNQGAPPLPIPYPLNGRPRYDRAVNTPGFYDTRSYAVRSRMQYDFAPDWSLAYVAGYGQLKGAQQIDQDGTTVNRAANLYVRDENHWSHELDLSHDSQQWKLLLGAFYFQEEPHTLLDSSANGAGDTQFYNLTIKQRSYAFFGQATYSLTDWLRATGGLRYTQDRTSRPFQNNYSCPYNTPLVPPGPPASAGCTVITHITDQDRRWNNVSWKAGLDADLSPTTLAYATVSTGFKTGGLGNNIAPDYGPEHVTNYEVGLKTKAFNNRLQANASLFWMAYKDLQVSTVVTIPGTTNSLAATVNAGRARVRGAELELVWAPTRDDRITGFATYLDATYTRFRNAIDSQTDPSGKTLVDVSGNDLVLSPKVSARIGWQHIFHLGGGTLVPEASVYWQDHMYLRPFNLDADKVGAYTKTDLTLTYTPPGGRWTVEGYAHNLENKAVAQNQFNNGTQILRFYSLPRTYGVRVGVKL